ncbi:MAG: cupin domain-containing protein [Phycisphaerales bacterium]
MLERVNLREKFALIRDHWNPRIAAEVNDALVKLVKFKGEFVWHHHEREDELFLVLVGSFRMQLRDGEVIVREGEFIVVPRGVEHRPVADEECSVMLIEPRSTLNTGNVVNERTRRDPGRV